VLGGLVAEQVHAAAAVDQRDVALDVNNHGVLEIDQIVQG
jgi:hypothetical protein